MNTATIHNKNIRVKFQYKDKSDFFAMVENIKKIPGRIFDRNSKSWLLPISKTTIATLKKLDFKLDDAITEVENNIEEKEKNTQKQIEKIEFKNEKLRPYQQEHAKKIIASIIKNNAAIDASDTGTGKTFVALTVAKYFNLVPVCLVPKSTISQWKKVAEYLGIEEIFISNYEQYKSNSTPYFCAKKTSEKTTCSWNTNENHIIIFDEAHKCKNYKTINSKMLLSVKKTDSKVLLLSATLADNPLQLYSAGILLKLFSNYQDFWRWAGEHGVNKGWFGYEFANNNKEKQKEHIKKIHNEIFPDKGSRIAIKDLGNQFPDNLIITDCFDMGSNSAKIQAIYEELQLLKIKQKKDKEIILTERLRARQEIELLKIPTLVEQAQNLIEESNAVCIFVNFKETIRILSKQLKTNCIIDGSTNNERNNNIESFQQDKERVILCNTKAGGVGISLHDINGEFPRVSLISPSDSAIDLKQVFGRIHRDGGKSKSIQKIIFCSDTIEESIAENVQRKIENIELLNDGDLIDV